MFLDGWDALCFCGWLALQDVRLDHLQVPVLGGDVAVFERDQDRASVLPGEPFLCLQGGIGAGRVRVQVVLEQIRLGGCKAWKKGDNIRHQ